jgi:hypothetical protein
MIEAHTERFGRYSPGWWVLPALLAAAPALVWLVGNRSQIDWDPGTRVEITLGAEHYRIQPQQLEWLRRLSEEHFLAGEAQALVLAGVEIDRHLEDLFAGARARLPAFADWYYSLGGEYSRLAMTALAAADLADRGYVAHKAGKILFPSGYWDNALTQLEEQTASRLFEHQRQLRTDWLGELARRLAPHRVPAPLPVAGPAGQRRPAAIGLDGIFERLIVHDRALFEQRVAISTLAAGGIAAGPALRRATTQRAAPASGRIAGRGAARAGSAASGAAAACSAGGVVAIGCALLAGAATWLATDWLLLRVDEQMNREAMISTLEQGLDDLRVEMTRELARRYAEVIAAHQEAAQSGIREGFVPARAGRP